MRLLYISIIQAVCILYGFAGHTQPVTVHAAKKIAGNHFNKMADSRLVPQGQASRTFRFSPVSYAADGSDTLYYILNDTINHCFAIVSADKRQWPVMGYSSEGIFNTRNQPPQFAGWMEDRKQELIHIRKNNLKPGQKTVREWEMLSSTGVMSPESVSTVEPLLRTTWNQGCYYNTLCPADAAGPCGHVVTGCVATSMAQIMKYWNYPTTGTGSHSYSLAQYGTQTANFGATTYLWDQMPNNLTGQNNAVATLMYHCGVAVDMNYGPGGSSAGVSTYALINYFKYSPNAQYVNKNSYSPTDWNNLLKTELDAYRPIWYRGSSPTAGHAFICDGYQGTDYFHFNWGWGGYEDGYYYLGNIEYNSNQAAIIKIYPSNLPDGFKGFFLSSNTLSLGANADTDSVRISSSAAWSASSNQSWVIINPASGIKGDAYIRYSAAENNSGSTRSATVTVSVAGYNSQTVTVTQYAKINVTAGSLKTLLAGMLATTVNLTLTGTVDARDFKTMRDDMPQLSRIDLSGVTIAAYSGTEGPGGTSITTYPSHTIPYQAFDSKRIMEKFRFPASAGTIDSYAFSYCTGLKSLFITPAITTINSMAFSNSQATITVDTGNSAFSDAGGILFNKNKTELIFCPVNITGSYVIPSSVISIARYAFFFCDALTSVTIPFSVTIINSNAFSGCSALLTVDPSNPAFTSEDGILYNRSKTTLIQCPSSKTGAYTVPGTVTRIETYAFFYCTLLTSVTLPSSLGSIGSNAFYYCKGLTSFYAKPVTPVNISSSSGVFNYINFTNCILHVPYGAAVAYRTAAQWSSFTNIVEDSGLALSVKSMVVSPSGETVTITVSSSENWNAASDQSWLTVNPASGSPGIKSVSITAAANPDNSSRNASLTFSAPGFSSQVIAISQAGKNEITPGRLKEVLGSGLATISSLTLSGSIDARDFKTMRDDMPSLTRIDLGNTTIVAYSGTEGTYSTSFISYPANTIPDRAFYNSATGSSKTGLISLTFNNSVNAIGAYAFFGCTGLTTCNLIIPVSSLGIQAFSYCTGLKTSSIPPSVTSIGSFAFYGSHISITVDPNNPVYSAMDGVLYNKMKSSLIYVPDNKTGNFIIPSTVTAVSSYAFYNCSGLTAITLPAQVSSIGNYAFNNCTGLSSLYSYPEIPVNLDSAPNVFTGIIKNTCTLYIPAGTKAAYQSALQWKDFTKMVELSRISVTPGSLTIGPVTGSSGLVHISANTAWNAVSGYNWISVNPSSGSGNAAVVVSAVANPGNITRSANVIFKTGGGDSVIVTITQQTKSPEDFVISMNSGWNIISSGKIPQDPDFQSLFQSPILNGSLLKIQDETGNSLEDLGLMGGWVNNIGNISPSEGYKVKVNRYTEVLVNGPQVTLPFSISLKPGWNIAGYPFPSEVNAMSVVQQLIDRGKLVKVQDDKGNAIEDWGVFGGWQNGIGNFKPGAGYKIKLSAADTLTIFESYPKSSTSVPQTAATVHFSIVGEGNGVDHMNINLVEIPDGFLETRDEIGIFDGGLCVGSMVFGNRYSVIGEKSKIKNQKSEITNISIPISASDGSGLNGFTEGNPFTLKLWKAQTKREYLLEPEIIKGTSTFLKHESTFASLAKYDATGLGNFILADKIDIKIYPNPTNGEIYISAGSSSLKGSEVQVANALGQVILHRIIGSDPDEISISGYVRGVYYITITHDHWSKTEKIILR